MGAFITGNGPIGLPASINLLSNDIQPIGSIIHDTGPLPAETYGRYLTPFSPEQVLFICTPNEEGQLFEGYIANSDSDAYKHKILHPDVSENTYSTRTKQIGWRAKNLDTGNYITDRWQLRPLTHLDKDKFGRILVKAKNFSRYQLELIKVPYPAPTQYGAYTPGFVTTFGGFDPFVYIYFISRSGETSTYYIPNCVGGALLSSCAPSSINVPHLFAGLGNKYPGGETSVTTTKGCAIRQVTPSVMFEPISVNELNNGVSRTGIVQVEYACSNGAVFGTGTANNAIGFRVPASSATLAENFGFKNPLGTGVSKLVADNYPDPASAKGVAIEIFPKNDPIALNWLTSSLKGGGHPNGWYKPNGILQNSESDSVLIYKVEYEVKLSKMSPSENVRPGQVNASAEVLIIVQ